MTKYALDGEPLMKFTDPIRYHVEAFLEAHAEEALSPRQVADASFAAYQSSCPNKLDENLVKYALDGSIVGLARRLLKRKVAVAGFGERLPQRLWADGKYRPVIGRNGRLLWTANELRAWANRGMRLIAIDRRAVQLVLRFADWMDEGETKQVGP